MRSGRTRGGGRRRVLASTYVVIMAGGQSTRFWPLGRRRVPKQFLSITGPATLLQETARRLVPLVSWRGLLIVTSAEHAGEVHRQLPRVPRDHVLVEPVGRNTAACIGLAAEWITERQGDGVMIVVPADHVIKDGEALRRALRAAASRAARDNRLVLLGVRPTRPETGYGYIEIGERVAGGKPATFMVRRFREKPGPVLARRYTADRRHLWNSGMFAWKASVFRTALERCLPTVRQALTGVWAAGRDHRGRLRRAYRNLPAVSVDVGVLQPLSRQRAAEPRIVAVRADFDWFDVGSWAAMPELWGCDTAGNAVMGKVLAIDSGDCIVYAPDRLVALVGVNDLIVADSGGALLVCPRQRAQDVRAVTRALPQRGWSRYL
jgi:mannose-1-phosphate guanylyltransferase